MHIFNSKFKHSFHFQAFPEPYSSGKLHIIYRQNDHLTSITFDQMLLCCKQPTLCFEIYKEYKKVHLSVNRLDILMNLTESRV